MMKYIDDKPELGLLYDWHKIRKDYKQLKIPKTCWTPLETPLGDSKYTIVLSERSLGKTTNVLLLGIQMYWNTDRHTQIQYIRQTEEMIAPKNTKDLFTVIVDPTYAYLERITNGRYNNVTYKSKRWYLCRTDDEGNIIETDTKHFMMMLSIDKASDYKSGYNAPYGDIIILDEMVSKRYAPNEFVDFCDIVKTIIRDRKSPIIFMLSNTLDKYSPYFNELGIHKLIPKMKLGESKTHTTDKGTKLYITIPTADKKNKIKREINSLFFGFDNPRLGAITGDDWAIGYAPHIESKEYNILMRKIYIEYADDRVRLDIVEDTDRHQMQCHVVKATKTYDDSYIYTVGDCHDSRYHYRLGKGNRLDKLLWNNLYKSNMFRYATNDCHEIVSSYVKEASKFSL